MGINRNCLVGRKRTRGPHFVWFSTKTLHHFLSPLFLFFSLWSRENYISGTLIDTFSRYTARWNNPRNFPAVDFDWIIGASK